MLRVSNGKCIRRLGWRAMSGARTRNLIAVLAIALTATLFTSLFTVAMSINDGFQQANFRQIGGYAHGGFKYLTEEQFYELRDDPLIKEWGVRRIVGMPSKEPFNKTHVEIGWADKNYAHWTYCDPIEGRLPREGTDEAAVSLRVLELLGVGAKLGNPFTVTFEVDNVETTQTFTLCGWWDYDEITPAHHIFIPESRVNAILAETGVEPGQDGITGTWLLDVMLDSTLHIQRDIKQVLANHGYQSEDRSDRDTYIAIGVSWGYAGSQLAADLDPTLVAAIAAVALLIIFTGYLIIYNVFQISVSNDIRFYGLLKTIGTTPRQIGKLLRQQAILLSLAGIPLGLLAGWLIGAELAPVVIARANHIDNMVSVHPLIFIVSAAFSLVTVLLSCALPGRKAAKVSPVEAVRYTEGGGIRQKSRRAGGGVSVRSMAWANLSRSRSKTAVTVASLALAVVLLDLTVIFGAGFDMDKYVSDKSVSDFIVAGANYFRSAWGGEDALSEDLIAEIEARGGITEGGRVYGRTSSMMEFVPEEHFRAMYSIWTTPEYLDEMVAQQERDEAGLIPDRVQLSGMEPYALDHLEVLEGDLSKLYLPGERYIAARYFVDDYGNPILNSGWGEVGDTITIRHIEESELYNPVTGEVYANYDVIGDNDPWQERAVKYRDVEYEVAALVRVPNALSYRYAGADEFVLNAETFIRDTGTDSVMLYAFDTAEEAADGMESFLSDYTSRIDQRMDYESKATYQAEFEGFRSTFLLLGGVLSFIVGLVGILNFFNAILTGILTRKREFAVLQSIGMTGGQLKSMLVWEGMFYALGSALAALLLSVVFGPVLSRMMEGMFWFYSFHPTVTPILLLMPVFVLLGWTLPLAVYRRVARLTIVERLREAEA